MTVRVHYICTAFLSNLEYSTWEAVGRKLGPAALGEEYVGRVDITLDQ
jgi:hypothetical protein